MRSLIAVLLVLVLSACSPPEKSRYKLHVHVRPFVLIVFDTHTGAVKVGDIGDEPPPDMRWRQVSYGAKR